MNKINILVRACQSKYPPVMNLEEVLGAIDDYNLMINCDGEFLYEFGTDDGEWVSKAGNLRGFDIPNWKMGKSLGEQDQELVNWVYDMLCHKEESYKANGMRIHN